MLRNKYLSNKIMITPFAVSVNSLLQISLKWTFYRSDSNSIGVVEGIFNTFTFNY